MDACTEARITCAEDNTQVDHQRRELRYRVDVEEVLGWYQVDRAWHQNRSHYIRPCPYEIRRRRNARFFGTSVFVVTNLIL